MTSNRAWLLVLVGVLISSFLGGAIRVLSSKDRVTEFVENIVQQTEPKFSITFSSADLRLADGLKPILAVELSDLVIKAKDACITNTVLEANHIVVPLQMIPFFASHVRFGDVHADKVLVALREATCETAHVAQNDDDVDAIAPLERFFQQRWNIEVVRTANYLQSLQVNHLTVQRNDELWFTAENSVLSFDPDKKRSNIAGRLTLGPKWIGTTPVGAFDIDGRINADNLSFKAHGDVREGQVQIAAEWRVNSGQVTYNADLTDLPFQSVLSFVQHWGALVEFKPTLHDEWFSCGLHFSGDIRNMTKKPLDLKGCRLYGDLGAWELQSTSLLLNQPLPLTVRMNDVDVLRWLQSFGWGSTWGVVAEFGRFTGEFTLQSANDFKLRGVLTNMMVYLSSLRDRAKQKVQSMNLDLLFSHDKFVGDVRQVKIENGELHGVINVDMNLSGEGDFSLAFDRVVLASPVQRVVWGGLAPDAALYGNGHMVESQLTEFTGRAELSALETHHWEMQNLKSTVHYKDRVWSFQPTAEKFVLRPESKWLRFVNTIGAAMEPHPREIVFRHLSAESDLSETGGHWLKFRATVPDGKTVVVSSGEWDDKAQIHGSLSADYNHGQHQSWAIGGNWIEPTLN
jgi:hypothetical protein